MRIVVTYHRRVQNIRERKLDGRTMPTGN